MKTARIIGFGGTFYTLWSVRSQMCYYTAPDGKHYPSYMRHQYTYHKNISQDIDKVKSMYPDTPIDLDLKGCRSFTIEKKNEDLTPEILKSGKYAGWDVRELAKHDFDYCMYMRETFWSCDVMDIFEMTPEYIEYSGKKAKALEEKCNGFTPLETGTHKLTISRNPDEDGVVTVQIADGHTIQLHFGNVQENYYNGYTYYLPVFSGKQKRIKGKELQYNLEITNTEINREHGYCSQIARVIE